MICGSGDSMAKATATGAEWMQKIVINCKATLEKVVVDAMDAAMQLRPQPE